MHLKVIKSPFPRTPLKASSAQSLRGHSVDTKHDENETGFQEPVGPRLTLGGLAVLGLFWPPLLLRLIQEALVVVVKRLSVWVRRQLGR
jgi:hypothetical protein